jgi:FKBP-type peptidyl-prolyl cis-trans isomerase
MSNFSTLISKSTVLACFVTGGILMSLAQTQTTQPATKPAAKKPSTATATKSAAAKEPAPLTTPKDKLSYAIGTDVGRKLKGQSIEVDPAVVERGMKDALDGNPAAMTDEEMRATLMDLSKQLREKQMAAAKEASEKNKKEGEDFLAANKSKEGVVALPSGLQYKVIKAGEGQKPTAKDTVVCNYRGTLIDGTEFDSSYKRGQPATFPVGGVIKGWTEALQLMPVGSKWQLFVPSELAYGERGAGGEIGPNATLVFEVELLSIQGADEKKVPDELSPPDSQKSPATQKPPDQPQR